MHEMISRYIHNNYNDITTLQNGWMLFVHDDTKNEREKIKWDVVWNLKTSIQYDKESKYASNKNINAIILCA